MSTLNIPLGVTHRPAQLGPNRASPSTTVPSHRAPPTDRRAPRDAVSHVNIRGTPFAPIEAFVRAQFRESGWNHFTSLLDPAPREIVTQPIIATNWYPFTIALDVVDGLVELAEGRTSVLRDFAIHNLDYATNVVFRAIFKAGSPQFMVARSNQVWKKYYSSGRMVCDVGRNYSRIELREFPYLSPNYEKLLMHSIEAVLLKAGGRLTRISVTKSALWGDALTEFTHEWV